MPDLRCRGTGLLGQCRTRTRFRPSQFLHELLTLRRIEPGSVTPIFNLFSDIGSFLDSLYAN